MQRAHTARLAGVSVSIAAVVVPSDLQTRQRLSDPSFLDPIGKVADALPEVGQRQAGWAAGHAEAGRTPDPALCRGVPFVTSRVHQETATLLRETITVGLRFAASDRMAMTATSTMRQHGVRVPQAMRVVGHDTIALAPQRHPPLCPVGQPNADPADGPEADARALERLARQLLARLAGERSRSALLPTTLVLRESSTAADSR